MARRLVFQTEVGWDPFRIEEPSLPVAIAIFLGGILVARAAG